MDRTQVFIALIGSAAVGALVSSVVTALAQWRERKARREELLLSKAIDLVNMRVEMVIRTGGKGIVVMDHAFQAQIYYKWLKHVMETGELPDDAKARQQDFMRDDPAEA